MLGRRESWVDWRGCLIRHWCLQSIGEDGEDIAYYENVSRDVGKVEMWVFCIYLDWRCTSQGHDIDK